MTGRGVPRVERGDVPAFTTDREGRITTWTDAAERLLGHSADNVIGRPCHEVIRGCDLFGHPSCSATCPLLQPSSAAGPPRPHILRLTDADGRMLDARVSVGLVHDPSGDTRLVHRLEPFVPRMAQVDHRPRATADRTPPEPKG